MATKFELLPFSGENFGFKVWGDIERTKSDIRLCFRLEGQLGNAKIPEVTDKPAFTEELWEHTCFECFLNPADCHSYFEWNFSPSKDWWNRSFKAYRDPDLSFTAEAPKIQIRSDETLIELSTVIPVNPGAFRVGLASVLELKSGDLVYWALNHPTPQPDFHDARSFKLPL